MQHDNRFKIPCLEKNGKLVTINDCKICRNRDHCDTYITIIEEDYITEKENE